MKDREQNDRIRNPMVGTPPIPMVRRLIEII